MNVEHTTRNLDLNQLINPANKQLATGEYFAEYHGHKIEHLEYVYKQLRLQDKQVFIYTCGDSSLDNKYWILQSKGLTQIENVAILNGYEHIFAPLFIDPFGKCFTVKDVCFWINKELVQVYGRKNNIACINTAVENTSLRSRKYGKELLPQDLFIRDHITTNDILIVSVGGNDIALHPTIATITHLATLLFITPRKNIPSTILLCMIYFPCEDENAPSWASMLLKYTGYNRNPEKLQLLIQKLYECATKKLKTNIEKEFKLKTTVKTIPLFDILDSKDKYDYVHRVEPSVQGGKKMAKAFVKSKFCEAVRVSDD